MLRFAFVAIASARRDRRRRRAESADRHRAPSFANFLNRRACNAQWFSLLIRKLSICAFVCSFARLQCELRVIFQYLRTLSAILWRRMFGLGNTNKSLPVFHQNQTVISTSATRSRSVLISASHASSPVFAMCGWTIRTRRKKRPSTSIPSWQTCIG